MASALLFLLLAVEGEVTDGTVFMEVLGEMITSSDVICRVLLMVILLLAAAGASSLPDEQKRSN